MTRRILVIDDEPAMVTSLCDILELHGWETLKGFDGDVAADLTVAHEVDVVLMDVRMPKVSGVEALRRIKARRPTTKVILMTAYTAQELLAQAEQEGVLRILKKPVEISALIALLESMANRPRSLLVIDDNADYLDTLCDALEREGLETLKARTLDEAVRGLESQSPGAVLLDLKLERDDAEGSVVAIRDVSPSVLLILYSGHDAELARTLAGESGSLVDASFTKPLPIDELVAFIDASGH